MSGQLLLFAPAPAAPADSLEIDGRRLPLRFRRNPRARRFVLYFRADGSLSLTLPARASLAAARAFAGQQHAWIRRRLRRHEARPFTPSRWHAGTAVLLHGQEHPLQPTEHGARLDSLEIPLPASAPDWRPHVEARLRQLAARELPPRTGALAQLHGFHPRRVVVRNQSSRWGSCSAQGTLSLNWRLIQAPPEVRDYVILHELCHLREMNHGPRFWSLLASLCPDHRLLAAWLKTDAHRLGL